MMELLLPSTDRKGFPFTQIRKAIRGLMYLENKIIENDNVALSRFYLMTRTNFRRVLQGRLSLVTIDDEVLWTYEWMKTFPCRYDMIVGIPRSGLLIGSIISTKLGVPLSTPDSFSAGIYWSGNRKEMRCRTFSNILIVDESIGTGETMNDACEAVRRRVPHATITRASLISYQSIEGSQKDIVDLCFKVILTPVLPEWELLDIKRGVVGMDLDGVICEECPPGIDATESMYLNWLKNAKPYLIPNYEVDFIISNRLEQYRPETEEWLLKNGVCYRKLILWNLGSKKERQGRFAEHKIEVLAAIKPDFFFESEDTQAKAIWTATKIPTICTDKMILYS